MQTLKQLKTQKNTPQKMNIVGGCFWGLGARSWGLPANSLMQRLLFGGLPMEKHVGIKHKWFGGVQAADAYPQ